MVGYFLPKARLPLLIVALIVAAERVLLAAHHPSDVWAGAMLGLLTSQLLIGRIGRREAVQELCRE
jgi:membrane-associated phospholipid phosphatase